MFLFAGLANAEPLSFSNVPFRSVEYSIGPIKSFIWFEGAVVSTETVSKNVSVALESVEIVLEKHSKTYTTLEILEAKNDDFGQWLIAKKVKVVTRNKEDFYQWQRFLEGLKIKQNREQKRYLEPARVLPPVVE